MKKNKVKITGRGGPGRGQGRPLGSPNKRPRKQPPPKNPLLRRISLHLSIPVWLAEKLREAYPTLSRYIIGLVLADKPEWKPPEQDK